jgi:tetratricopeptide (TPR) repeat protein
MLLFVATRAYALDVPDACPPRPTDEDSASALARIWFSKGEKSIAEKDYTKALGEFECSLRMHEHEATLFNAARAAYLAGRYDDAISLAEKNIAQAGDDATRAEARKLLAQAEAARLEAERGPPQGEEAGPVPGAAVAPAVDTDDSRPAGLKIAGVVSGAAGIACLIVGTVMQVLAGSASKTTEETESYQEYKDATSRLDGLQTGAIVSFAAGGALLGAGFVMLLVGNRNKDEKEPVAVSLTPTPGALVLGGTF